MLLIFNLALQFNPAAVYLEWDFCAHGSAMSDDWFVVWIFSIPAVKLNASTASKQNLEQIFL